MPRVSFDELPPDARVWIFGAERPLVETERARVLDEVDAFIGQWAAHDVPLTTARDLRYDQFIFVAVDERAAGASGCSNRCPGAADEGVAGRVGGRAGEPRAGAVSRREPASGGSRASDRPGRIGVDPPGNGGLRQHGDHGRRRSRRPLGAARGELVARPGVLLVS